MARHLVTGRIGRRTMDKLKLLMLSEKQDCEAFEEQDFEKEQTFKEKYFDYHDDVKQPCKHIKEDW